MADSPPAWRARPGCPEHLRRPLEKAVNAYPAKYLLDPANQETFETAEECQERLRIYSLSQGFDIVKGGGGKPGNPGYNFLCVYHGKGTRNWRGLEDHVERNDNGEITSNRKRDFTHIRGTSCQWSCRVSWKSVGKRNSGIKAFVLTVKSLEYSSHPLSDNPLIFAGHRDRLAEFQAAKSQARLHRLNTLPFSASRRILDSNDFGVVLTSKEYYNSVRFKPASKDDDKLINGLVVALQNEEFVYETRLQEVVNETGQVVSRKCLQIWFSHPDLLKATSRFVAGSVCIIDATFNINRLRMPIIVAVGVLNIGKTFPVAFSFCPSENHDSYTFFWESLKLHLPEGSVAPAVIISDQAKAIHLSINECFPSARHQICSWHAIEAMKAKFRRIGHTTEQINGRESATSESLSDLAWAYIDADTQEALETRRNDLKSQLLEPEYLDEWQDKEDRVVALYTAELPNLGHRSSQRSESYHNVVTQITNGQLDLETAIKRLCQTVKGVVKEVAESTGYSLASYPRGAQGAIF
ncbi:MULE transposase domain-containing protein [Cladophialophora immunda]|nr:MULE transposase domain-containing protein [Cladophialophora immunda]